MGKGIVKLGEGNWAVKDGNLLAAKETNGRFKNAEFTVTRGTDATYVGKDGLIKTASFYNLFPYSEDFENQWTAQSGITITNNTTETTSPSGEYNASKVVSTDSTKGFSKTGMSITANATRTIYLKGSVGGESVTLKDGSGNGGTETYSLTTNWVRYELKTTADGNTYQGLFVDNISVGTIYAWGAQIVEGTEPLDYQYTNGKEGIPRIDFTDNTDGHLLLEPQSTNLLPYSEDFLQSFWNNTYGEVISDNLVSAPDGSISAQKWKRIAGTYNLIRPAVNITGTDKTLSVFVKNISADNFYLRDTSGFYFYNFSSQTVSNSNLKVEQYPNGWVRLSTSNTNDNFKQFGIGENETDSTELNNEVYIWGAQVEALSYPTSYIPTNGSQVTRDGETCTGAGEAADFNSEEGVLYAEIATLSEDNDEATKSISLSFNATNRVMILTNSESKTQVNIRRSDNSLNKFAQALTPSESVNFNKIAILYKSGQNKIFVNGSRITNTDFDNFTFDYVGNSKSFNKLEFANGGGGGNFQGKCKAIRVYKEALSDTDLENLTS